MKHAAASSDQVGGTLISFATAKRARQSLAGRTLPYYECVMRPRFLNTDEFAQVVRNTPLVAIDLIIRDPDRCVLVGLRTNEPAKGKWFVPGGVVRKYERLADAFARIVKAEIGFDASIGNAKFIGVYEHLYDKNVFEEEEFGTHYVVLAHELNLDHRPPIVSDQQHIGFRWMMPAELISLPDVHQNTRAYFL
jgi:colanic acid biosynthesis protein WcaH